MSNAQPPLSRALKHLFTTAPSQCESMLHRCATRTKSLPTTQKLHAYVITSDLLSTHFLSLLTAAYGLCGYLSYARKLFDESPKRTVVSYKGMIRMYVENGFPRNALELFVEMRSPSSSGVCAPDEYTYPFVARACGELVLLELGKVVHGMTLKGGFVLGSFVGNSLLAMYTNCGDVNSAKLVFEEMPERTVVSWNTMISGLNRNGHRDESLVVFQRMVDCGAEIDSATILSILPVCGNTKALDAGRQVHNLVDDLILGNRLPIRNALIDMYVKCDRMDEARLVFDTMAERDVVTWTTVIHGYVLASNITGALEVCRLMQLEGVKPNEVTLASLLAMCASSHDLKLGKCLHGWAVRHDVDHDVNVVTALIDLYSKCDSFKLGYRVFSKTCEKRTVPWNAILTGCLHNDLYTKAIELFKQMLLEEVELNDATFKSLLPAYAIEADLHQAGNIHSYLIRSGFVRKPDIITGLIDIYSKCGSLQNAHRLFDSLPVKKRDIVSWSVIIAGYGKHGHGKTALDLFNRMVESGVEPNEVTFTSTLHACGHSGLLDEGLCLFNFMMRNHRERLRADHYTCMVDLLGRAGRLREAHELIETMVETPLDRSSRACVWGALLGACAIHEDVEYGEIAAERLFEIEPENTGNYVLLGNIYSAVGRFDDAERVRRKMDRVGLVKAPANSSVVGSSR